MMSEGSVIATGAGFAAGCALGAGTHNALSRAVSSASAPPATPTPTATPTVSISGGGGRPKPAARTPTPATPGRFSARILQGRGKPGFAGTPGLTIQGGKTRPNEFAFANELVGLGYCVVYRGDQPGNDFVINDLPWELQTLDSGSVAAVDNALREGIPQGQGRVIIDGRSAGLTYETAARALAEREKYGRLAGTVDIRILLGDGREYRWP